MRKTRLIRFLLSLISCVYVGGYSQTDSLGWSYFPYRTGDMWEYWTNDGITVDTAQIINIKDSVSSDGKIHLMQYRRFINPTMHDPFLDSPRYTIDTAVHAVSAPYFTDTPVTFYRFDAQRGEQWVMEVRPGGGYEMARVAELYEGMLFGKSTTFMQMHYYGAADSTDTTGLGRQADLLAKGFGLVERFPSEPGGWWYSIKGAVINGILYGDTTDIVTSIDNPVQSLPREFELFQNYPNPFNPSTTIEFDLLQTGNVRVEIFDLLGREIATLLNDWKRVGKHTIQWSALGLPSGVYVCRLNANGLTQTIRILHMK